MWTTSTLYAEQAQLEFWGIWLGSKLWLACSATLLRHLGRHGGRIPVGHSFPRASIGALNVSACTKKAADAGATTLHQTIIGTGIALG